MKKIIGYYGDRKGFYVIVSSLGCYLTNLSWRKLYRGYKQ